MTDKNMSARINLDKLQEGLCTKRFGKRIVFLREVGSTNDYAKKLASYGAPEGTIVIAERQTAGRGRLGREWVSPKGGLYFSIVLRPKLSANEAVRLVFVAGLAAVEALREKSGLKVEIKWPNDVLMDGRKVCGILAEITMAGERVNYVVVGVGVNANFDARKALPEELWKSATSLECVLGRKVGLEELFRALLGKLDDVYVQFLEQGFSPVLEKWKTYAGFLGHQVEVGGEGERLCGLALDVDGDGALVVRLENGIVRRVLVGDVSLRQK